MCSAPDAARGEAAARRGRSAGKRLWRAAGGAAALPTKCMYQVFQHATGAANNRKKLFYSQSGDEFAAHIGRFPIAHTRGNYRYG